MNKKLLVCGIIVSVVVAVVVLGYYASIPYISPAVRGEKFLRVVGSSMAPTTKNGATITYEETPFESLKVGDIMVLRKPDSNALVVTRIIRITPEGLETKRDNLPQPDPWKITAKEYVGKVVRIDNPPF